MKVKMFMLTEDIGRNGNPDRIGSYVYNEHEVSIAKRHLFTEIEILTKQSERKMLITESTLRGLFSNSGFSVEAFIDDNFSEEL